MINHARTLLLNLPSGEGSFEEYIPEDFVPITLPKKLAEMRYVVFGNVCRNSANYRVRQIMTILHARAEEHVFALDQRVTYLPFCVRMNKEPEDLPPLKNILQFPVRNEFLSLWHNGPFADRFCAAALTLIYAIEDLRHAMEGHQILAVA